MSSSLLLKCPTCGSNFPTAKSLNGHFGVYPTHSQRRVTRSTCAIAGVDVSHHHLPPDIGDYVVLQGRKRKSSKVARLPAPLLPTNSSSSNSSSSENTTSSSSDHDSVVSHDDDNVFSPDDNQLSQYSKNISTSPACHTTTTTTNQQPFVSFRQMPFHTSKRIVGTDADNISDSNSDNNNVCSNEDDDDSVSSSAVTTSSDDHDNTRSTSLMSTTDSTTLAGTADNDLNHAAMLNLALPPAPSGPPPVRNAQDVLTLDLIQILRKAGAKLETYSQVLTWAAKAQRHQFNFSAPIPTCKLFLSSFAEQLGISKMYPKSISTHLPTQISAFPSQSLMPPPPSTPF